MLSTRFLGLDRSLCTLDQVLPNGVFTYYDSWNSVSMIKMALTSRLGLLWKVVCSWLSVNTA